MPGHIQSSRQDRGSDERRKMSEVELIMARFEDGRAAESRESGHNPDVCIAGEWDYSNLIGVINTLYFDTSVTDESGRGFLFKGVKIYRSMMFKRGFVFGCKERGV